MTAGRTLAWDWYPGTLPANAVIDETAYVETTYSFHLCRSELPAAVRIGRGASTYLGTMFDVGPRGRVTLGEYALVHGARIICDAEVEIGDFALISWNVVLMDTYRLPLDPLERRQSLREFCLSPKGERGKQQDSSFALRAQVDVEARPIRIGPNVWIGFDACVLPGVTVGRGAVIGARSVVVEDVPPYAVVAGNPARVVRRLEEEAGHDG